MKKADSATRERKKRAADVSYGLRRKKTTDNTIKQKPIVKKVTAKQNVKLRPQKKQLTNDSTKYNISPCVVRLETKNENTQTVLTPKTSKSNKNKTSEKSPKVPEKYKTVISPCVVRLGTRLENLKKNKNYNKCPSTAENKSTKPARFLRKRILIPNQYKDLSLNSPVINKKTVSSDPYEFVFDSEEEPTKKKRGKMNAESSNEDNSIKMIIKKLRRKELQLQKKVRKQTNVQAHKTIENDTNIKQMNVQTSKTVDIEKQKTTAKSDTNIKQMNVQTSKTVDIEQQKTAEVPQILAQNIEMVSLSDSSDQIDPISALDPSIQAQNIVAELTKSFIEDIPDEASPKKIVRPPKNPKIFNSTTNDFKPSKPWRLDVSAVRKNPQFFTYKDKSFTPRYEPEILFDIDKSLEKPKNNPKIVKPTYQTSILDFVKNTKPTIIENKTGDLFSDPKNIPSPRKVLGEINFVQSTPLRLNNLNILKSPNLSLISPKKKKESLFGFSFTSEEENKENLPQSPKKNKLKFRLKNSPKKIITNPKQNNAETNLKLENITTGSEISPPVSDTDLSINLFQDMDKLEVSKKSTRKYVRKLPKRKRILSTASGSDEESEAEPEPDTPKKKRRKNVMSEEEEKEADRLATYYNSMFEEIGKYPLIIE